MWYTPRHMRKGKQLKNCRLRWDLNPQPSSVVCMSSSISWVQISSIYTNQHETKHVSTYKRRWNLTYVMCIPLSPTFVFWLGIHVVKAVCPSGHTRYVMKPSVYNLHDNEWQHQRNHRQSMPPVYGVDHMDCILMCTGHMECTLLHLVHNMDALMCTGHGRAKSIQTGAVYGT